MGATEYGQQNSKILITLHFLYYAACFTEGYFKHPIIKDALTIASLIVYVLSITILYCVIYQIRQVWTVKLIIGAQSIHQINRSFLFKYFRHPNYYLNILPELIALAILFRAWYTGVFGLPLYLYFLINRIREEEKLMRRYFDTY